MSPSGFAAALVVVGFAPLAGQSPKKSTEPERLFRSRSPLVLTIRAPFKELFKNRDTLKLKPQSGTIEFADERKGQVSLPITLETRGHFRLLRAGCSFAPLKVKFDKEAAKGTEFAGQGGIKLATHCQNGKRFEQNLLVEEAIYRMYNLVTPFSHRTRLARITYVPTDDTAKTVTRYGFFMEDDGEMAKRNEATLLMQTGGKFEEMDQPVLDLAMVFEYLIGNTDWSIFMIHNFRILAVNGKPDYVPVAYDFDFSGLVAAPYSAPDERLPIKTVKQRLYRGPCKKVEELVPTLGVFAAKKDSLYRILRDQPGLEPGRIKEAIDYLEGFYEDIKKPKDFDGALGYACRGR